MFWNAFLRGLKRRGLSGLQLVISDAHDGLKAAIAKQLQGAAWQRCKVHFQRNVLSRIGKDHGETVNAMIRTIFAQPNAKAVRAQLRTIAHQLASAFPKVAEMLLDAEADLTAFADFPKSHWRRIWSTNPLERVNKEIKRRTKVVGIFPDDAAIIRLVGAVLLDVHDEWQVADRATSPTPRWPRSTTVPTPRRSPPSSTRHGLPPSRTVEATSTTQRDSARVGAPDDPSGPSGASLIQLSGESPSQPDLGTSYKYVLMT